MIDGAAGFVVLHGATVCGPTGSVFIAGRSEAGKTTLALGLAARGHAVMSDDIALLEPVSGAIHPVPRCFHLDDRSRRLLRRAGLRLPDLARHYGFVSPADVNPPRSGAVVVRHIVLLESKRGPAPLLTSLPQAGGGSRSFRRSAGLGGHAGRIRGLLAGPTGGWCVLLEPAQRPPAADRRRGRAAHRLTTGAPRPG